MKLDLNTTWRFTIYNLKVCSFVNETSKWERIDYNRYRLLSYFFKFTFLRFICLHGLSSSKNVINIKEKKINISKPHGRQAHAQSII